jgi:lipoprotein-anchoring transpeptidase ErfK/SrfK
LNIEPPASPAPSAYALDSVEPDSAPSSPADDPAAEATTTETTTFDRVMLTAQAKIQDEQWYEALFTLSLHYNSADISEKDHQALLDLLDPLAGKVIYSTEHHIRPAHEVRRGETLKEIGKQYEIPWQLLANVNGIENPDVLVPGTKLKIVPGPFRAEVDLTRNELTLFVDRLYAGRFPISVGGDPAPQPGDYQVHDKQVGRTYYAGDGRTIPAEDPSNPFGQIWIDLGGDVCIHGTANTGDARLGCISLSPVDANDVYGILSRGSKVQIRR